MIPRADRYLFRTNPDGTRQVSRRGWILVWVTPVVFTLAVAYLVLQVFMTRESTVQTTGEVVKVYKWDSDNPFDSGPFVYSPLVRYTWTDGQPTQATAGVSYSEWNFPVGTKLAIRYNPDEKSNIVIVGPTEWLVAKVVGILAAITAVLSLLATLLVLRWVARGKPKEAKA